MKARMGGARLHLGPCSGAAGEPVRWDLEKIARTEILAP